MYWGKPNSEVAHKHQTLESKPGVLLRTPQCHCSEEPAAGTAGKAFFKHVKIGRNSSSRVETHAF